MADIDLHELRRRVGTFDEPAGAARSSLFDEDPAERAALTTCHSVLASKLVTERQLRDKLVAAEHAPEHVEHAIERCRAGGLIDDRRYAEQWVESRVRRGQGAQRIRRDLAQRGVDRGIVDEALAELQDTGALEDGAIDAARRRFARVDLHDSKARAKAMRWLLGRGYSSSQADGAIRVVRAEADDRDG